jgi:hypothetical protein
VWDEEALVTNFGPQLRDDLLKATADVVALQQPLS